MYALNTACWWMINSLWFYFRAYIWHNLVANNTYITLNLIKFWWNGFSFSIYLLPLPSLSISLFYAALFACFHSFVFWHGKYARGNGLHYAHLYANLTTQHNNKNRYKTDPVASKAYILGDTNSSKVVDFNQPAEIRCLAGGFPKPSVTWWRNTDILPLKSTRFEVNRDYSLVFNSIELRDLGNYICQAYSGQGRPVSMYVTLMAIDNGAVRAEHPEDEPYLQYVVPAPRLPPTHNNYPPTPPQQPPLEQEPNGKPIVWQWTKPSKSAKLHLSFVTCCFHAIRLELTCFYHYHYTLLNAHSHYTHIHSCTYHINVSKNIFFFSLIFIVLLLGQKQTTTLSVDDFLTSKKWYLYVSMCVIFNFVQSQL